MSRPLIAYICLVFVFSVQTARADDSLVTDISSHLISVTSDFTGTELLLFGTVKPRNPTQPTAHGDIIVVVRGPASQLRVRKKERVVGIWANTQSKDIDNVPGFYSVSSNRPIQDITNEETLKRLKLGPDRLQLTGPQGNAAGTGFGDAVLRQRAEEELYSSNENSVYFLGNSLFRASIYFPANVPVGNYISEVYLFDDGELISAQTSPLFIKKSGLGRRVYDFAQNYPALHGIAAIILALIAGWIASAVFRKD